MKKTKIICTMGPNTNDRELLKKLALNGMDIARFNFSHGDYEEQLHRINLLKSVREEIGRPIAMLLDTKGPEIRTGIMAGDRKVRLKEGDTYILTTDKVEGGSHRCSVTYPGLVEDLSVGNRILIDDGLIELQVQELTQKDIICTVVNGGELGQKKGVNVPNVSVKLPALTQKDKDDILFGIEQGFDFIAASFVRSAACVKEIKDLLKEHGAGYIPVISKIENAEGIQNFDEIMYCSDGIMVARGDLGVEIPAEEVPYLQKQIIKKCNDNYKPVITATQMLDSMIRNPRPTRAEVTDVANAIYDGTDAVMLSGETAMGKYPVEALKMMSKIAEFTESNVDYEQLMEHKKMHRKNNISSAVAYSSVATAANLGAKCIVTPTVSGATARMMSKFRPKVNIIGVSPNEATLRKMQIYWGVYPLLSVEEDTTEEIMDRAVELAKEQQFVEKGDIVVLTAGIPSTNVQAGKGSMSNTMRVVIID